MCTPLWRGTMAVYHFLASALSRITKHQRRETVCHLAVFASPATTSSAIRHSPDKSINHTSSSVCSLLPLFFKLCLDCMDSKAGEKVLRPLGATDRATRPDEVLQFDYLYVGDSGPLWLRMDRMRETGSIKYI